MKYLILFLFKSKACHLKQKAGTTKTIWLRLRSATEIEETLIDQINPVAERSRSHMVLAAPAYCFK